jgi:hypothetical protein
MEEEDCVPEWLSSFVADTDRKLEEAQSKLLGDDKSTAYSCTDSTGSALTNLTLRTNIMKEDEEDLKLKEKICNSSGSIISTIKIGNDKIYPAQPLLVKESHTISEVEEDVFSSIQAHEHSLSTECNNYRVSNPEECMRLKPSNMEIEEQNKNELDSNNCHSFDPQESKLQETPKVDANTATTCNDIHQMTGESIFDIFNINSCIDDENVISTNLNDSHDSATLQNSKESEPSAKDFSPQLSNKETIFHEVSYLEAASSLQGAIVNMQTSNSSIISPRDSENSIGTSGSQLDVANEDRLCRSTENLAPINPEISVDMISSHIKEAIVDNEKSNNEVKIDDIGKPLIFAEQSLLCSGNAIDDTTKIEMEVKDGDSSEYINGNAWKLQSSRVVKEILADLLADGLESENQLESTKTFDKGIQESKLNEQPTDGNTVRISLNVGSQDITDPIRTFDETKTQSFNRKYEIPTSIPLSHDLKDANQDSNIHKRDNSNELSTGLNVRIVPVLIEPDIRIPGIISKLEEYSPPSELGIDEIKEAGLTIDNEVGTVGKGSCIEKTEKSSVSDEDMHNLENEHDFSHQLSQNCLPTNGMKSEHAITVNHFEASKTDDKSEANVISPTSPKTIFFQHLKNGLIRIIIVTLYIYFLFATSKTLGLNIRILNQQSKKKGIKFWRVKVKNRDYEHSLQKGRNHHSYRK